MTAFNMSPFNVTHPANLMLSIVTGTLGAFGVPGNFVLMIVIAAEYRKRRPHEWLLFTLTLGDFLLCLNNAILEATFITNFHRVECKVAGAIDYVLGTVSFLTPPVVAYNRYLSLYNSQLYTKLFTNFNVFFAWGFVLLFGLCWITPFIVTGSLGQDDLGLCGTQMTNWFLMGIMLTVLVIVMSSYIVLVYFSYKVVCKIRNHKRDAMMQSNLQSRLINESQEIITAMLIISAIPLVAQIPGAVTKALQIFLPLFDPWISRSAIAPFPTTSAINAYVTAYAVKDYRNKFKRFFGGKNIILPKTVALRAASSAAPPGGGWLQQSSNMDNYKIQTM